MNKRLIGFASAFAVAHFLLSILSGFMAMTITMNRWDHPDLSPSLLGEAAGALADILMMPASLIWTSWMSKNMPNILEWILMLANSALWGFVIAFGFKMIMNRRSSPSSN